MFSCFALESLLPGIVTPESARDSPQAEGMFSAPSLNPNGNAPVYFQLVLFGLTYFTILIPEESNHVH